MITIDDALYDQTAILGLYHGLRGPQRGKYYISTKSGMVRLRSPLNSSAMREEIAAVCAPSILLSMLDPETTGALAACMARAKTRAVEQGREFSLDRDWLIETYRAQGKVCALTGMAFRPLVGGGIRRNPFAPSIDRIECGAGYTKGNCQITTVIANVAKADFSLSDFQEMCANAAANKRSSVPEFR